MLSPASLLMISAGLVGQAVVAQDSDLAHSFNHSKLLTTTVIRTTMINPVVTLYETEILKRQAGCVMQSLGFCADVSRSLFSMASMTTVAPSPTSSTVTQEGPFAIEVQLLLPVAELNVTQYLAIGGSYVVLYPGPHIPGWYLDSNGNLAFDNTGVRLGVSPLDSPASKRRRIVETTEGDSGYDTVVAGGGEAPSGAKVFTKWAGNLEMSTTAIRVLDENNEVALSFLGCKFMAPDFGVEAWQLEAVYNVERFLESNDTVGKVDPAFCAPVRLLPVTSVPVSTAVSSHTSNYISKSSSMTTSTSATPTPTESSWTSFPILVNFDTSNSPDSSADYYIEEDANGYAYVDTTSSPPYYRYLNDTQLLSSEVTGNYLKIAVVDTPSRSAKFKRQTTTTTDDADFFKAIVSGENILPATDYPQTFIICPPNSTSDNDTHSLVLAYNPDDYIQQDENSDCVTASLNLNRDAPIPTTTTVNTTITTTTTPTATATALSPNVSGCNALNYTIAYSTIGVMNSFATACWCYSYIASTVSGTTTLDCTPTIYKVVPSITSISVSGALSSSTSGTGATRTDRESINSHRNLLPRSTTIVRPPSTTATTYQDITVIPTPTDWLSSIDASPVYFTSYCTSLFDESGIEALTITSLSVVSSTVSLVTISQTTVQTVCYQEVWEPAVTMSTPAIVICPATVTGGS
ncbi:hypothetical protein TWF730_001525 [Orbilia blumenaviensis]|uniref:Uncharacterized protein n=1 Tax=Orbilia blumenaviensis TaxID=1796055 RepID=A0AAV9UI02_9PEZI